MLTTGLFAGIGGIELGFQAAGHETSLLVENFPAANHVLRIRFPEAKTAEDVRYLNNLPRGTGILTAGFPCQDLSSVGPKIGISGTKSSLVGQVFSLLERRATPVVVMENVPFLLDLDRGRALLLITSALDELGYRWAYRILDAQAFGVPQRRRRWYLVAALSQDPRDILLAGEADRPSTVESERTAYGFYWTEGTRALGWAVDSVPPIKCGSTVGVASPPAIVMPDGSVVTPDVRDAERLQGFPADWTQPAEDVGRASWRWRLVGNAVCVPVAEWLGHRIQEPGEYDTSGDTPLHDGVRWPKAAWGDGSGRWVSKASDTPVWRGHKPISDFLSYPAKPLSARASRGFLNRAAKGNLRFKEGFLERIEAHAAEVEDLGGRRHHPKGKADGTIS